MDRHHLINNLVGPLLSCPPALVRPKAKRGNPPLSDSKSMTIKLQPCTKHLHHCLRRAHSDTTQPHFMAHSKHHWIFQTLHHLEICSSISTPTCLMLHTTDRYGYSMATRSGRISRNCGQRDSFWCIQPSPIGCSQFTKITPQTGSCRAPQHNQLADHDHGLYLLVLVDHTVWEEGIKKEA
jgi:hypothetical protein